MEGSNKENQMMLVTSSFSRTSVFKPFSVHTKTQIRRFQIPSTTCVAKGGSWGARDPPFVSHVLSKQPTTGGKTT